MSNYCFPILSAKELAEALRKLYPDNVDITEKDVRSPERKKWQKIYTLILCDCCPQLTPDNLNQIPLMSDIAYPELFEDSMPFFNLLRCMQALLTTCGVNDFKPSDIIAPKPKRIITIFSALLNFLFFQEERFKVYEKLKSENDARQDQRQMLLMENEEFKQRINAIKARQAEVEAEMDTILKSIAEWNEKTSALHQSVAANQKQCNDIKLKMAEIKSSLAHCKDEIIKEREQNNRLAAKIVPSPDRLKGEMERMQQQLAQAEQIKEDREMALTKLAKRQQLLQEYDQDVDVALRCLDAIQQENDKQKRVLASINNIQEENSNKKTEMKHLDAKIQHLRLQISNKQEKLEKLTIQHSIKMNDRKAALEHLEQELSNTQLVCGEKHSQSQAVRTELEMVKDKQREEMHACEETMSVLEQKYKELLEMLDLYHQRFADACQNVISTG